MPAQHGQTYDPNEEPTPRGGWFGFVERPFPERLDRAFRVLAIVVAVAAGGAVVWFAPAYSTRPPVALTDYGWFFVGAAMATALAYGFTRGIGMLLVGIYGTTRDGSEFVVDWRAMRYDLRLRRTWIVLLEGALLLGSACVSLWALLSFFREWRAFDLAVFATIQAMTYWPLIRRRIAGGGTPG